MSKINSTRNGCRDVFHSFLVSDATYDGKFQSYNLQLSCRIVLFHSQKQCIQPITINGCIFMKMTAASNVSGTGQITISLG